MPLSHALSSVRGRWRTLFCLGLLWSCRDDSASETADAGESAAGPAWRIVAEDVEDGALMSVWGSSATDIWVVGGQHDAGVALRGQDLAPQALPGGTPLLDWVHGTSPDDVWVCGLGGTILHWDGEAWADHSLATEEAFWGLYAVSERDLMAVGGLSAWGGESAVAAHYDGSSWTLLDLPDVHDGLDNYFKVSHDGERYWIVGSGGAAATSDGATLQAVGTGYAGDLVTVTSGEAGVVVVGGRGTGVVMEPSGDVLEKTATATAGLNGVTLGPGGRALVVGEYGYGGVYDLFSHELEPMLPATQDILHGSWTDADGRSWAVGGNLNTSEEYFHGVVLTTDVLE